MGINGIGAAGYPAVQYGTKKTERNAAGKNFAAVRGKRRMRRNGEQGMALIMRREPLRQSAHMRRRK